MTRNYFEQPGLGFTLFIVSMFLLGATMSLMAMTDMWSVNPFEASKNYPLLAIQATAFAVTARVVFKYFKYRTQVH